MAKGVPIKQIQIWLEHGEHENDLRKYGILRLWYLHEHKYEMYRKPLLIGKLPDHCRVIEKSTFDRSKWIQAQAIADEIILAELIYT